MYVREPESVNIGKWSDFVTPLELNLWYAILGSNIIFGIMLSGVHNIGRSRGNEEAYDHVSYHVTEPLFQVFGLYCQQGETINITDYFTLQLIIHITFNNTVCVFLL